MTASKTNTNKHLKLVVDDSRRLTGKGLDWDYTGAIMDCFVSGIDKQIVVDCWQKHIDTLLTAVGWELQHSQHRIFEDGISFLISAPMDTLYAATEINEAAWALCCDQLLGINSAKIRYESIKNDRAIAKDDLVNHLKQLIADEENPTILSWMQQAANNNVPCLFDDDEISLGHGKSCKTWRLSELPDLNTIQWEQFESIPIAMVTGTNGKSTSVRVTAEMVKAAGISCGITSTDFIRVADEIIDEGDYSGPGGARILLRNNKTEMALLEVARGGLLRRGLAVEHIDAALITNIAEDHFGQYGINNLDALTQAKCIVAKALTAGNLVLNGDDPQLIKASKTLDKNIIWFSLDKHNEVFEKTKNLVAKVYVDDGMMVFEDHSQRLEVITVNDVSMTINGAAKHNIQNALGAIALAMSLEIDLSAIRHALKYFNSDASDNPGRGNRYQVNGAEVIVDFAHNTHSMQAMAETVKEMPANNKYLLLSAAGDRSDTDIQQMVSAALTMRPTILIIAEIEEYLRGRKIGEIPQLIKRKAMQLGLEQKNIIICENPLIGAETVIQKLGSGDLGLIMALTQRQQISELLSQQ